MDLNPVCIPSFNIPAGIVDHFSAAPSEAESSRDETPMQVFFEQTPVAMLCLLHPHTAWFFHVKYSAE